MDGASVELREAATTLRGLVPSFRDTAISEYVPVAAAKLLDAIADSLDRQDPVRDQITSSALEIARHLRAYRPFNQGG